MGVGTESESYRETSKYFLYDYVYSMKSAVKQTGGSSKFTEDSCQNDRN